MFKIISNDFCQMGLVGRNNVWLVSRRPERVRSWELHHKNRRIALFLNMYVRSPKYLILNGSWRDRVRLLEIEKCLRHFGVVILALEAEILSELKCSHALSIHMGPGSWFHQNQLVYGLGRVAFSEFLLAKVATSGLRSVTFSAHKGWWCPRGMVYMQRSNDAAMFIGSYLDVLRELGADNYTIRIAASRSLWIYG